MLVVSETDMVVVLGSKVTMVQQVFTGEDEDVASHRYKSISS